MEPLDDHLASINNTILSSSILIAAAFRSCAETRAVVHLQHMELDRIRANLSLPRSLDYSRP